jgi:hypothetical protein
MLVITETEFRLSRVKYCQALIAPAQFGAPQMNAPQVLVPLPGGLVRWPTIRLLTTR